MIGHKDQAVPATTDGVLCPTVQGCLKERPSQIKLATEATKKLDASDWGSRHDRQVKSAGHAFKRRYFSRTFSPASAAFHDQINESPRMARI
jgi:hypothetical protein